MQLRISRMLDLYRPETKANAWCLRKTPGDAQIGIGMERERGDGAERVRPQRLCGPPTRILRWLRLGQVQAQGGTVATFHHKGQFAEIAVGDIRPGRAQHNGRHAGIRRSSLQ